MLLQAEAIARYLPRLIDGHADAVRPLAAWLVVAGLARALAAGASDWSATVAVTATRTTVRRRVLDRVVGLRADRRHDLGPATASVLTTTSSDALEPWIRSYLPGLSLAVAVPLVSGLRILGADLISAVILAVVVPLVPILMILIGLATESQAAKPWEALTRLAARFLDVLTGLPTLRLFGRADAQVSRVREFTDRYRQATMKTLRVAFLSALVLELLTVEGDEGTEADLTFHAESDDGCPSPDRCTAPRSSSAEPRSAWMATHPEALRSAPLPELAPRDQPPLPQPGHGSTARRDSSDWAGGWHAAETRRRCCGRCQRPQRGKGAEEHPV